jgi:hypothetical protein
MDLEGLIPLTLYTSEAGDIAGNNKTLKLPAV